MPDKNTDSENPLHRNIFQRVLDRLFGLRVKNKNIGGEQTPSKDELFDPEWEAEKKEIMRDHADTIRRLHEGYNQAIYDAKKDLADAMAKLEHEKKKSERTEVPRTGQGQEWIGSESYEQAFTDNVLDIYFGRDEQPSEDTE